MKRTSHLTSVEDPDEMRRAENLAKLARIRPMSIPAQIMVFTLLLALFGLMSAVSLHHAVATPYLFAPLLIVIAIIVRNAIALQVLLEALTNIVMLKNNG